MRIGDVELTGVAASVLNLHKKAYSFIQGRRNEATSSPRAGKSEELR